MNATLDLDAHRPETPPLPGCFKLAAGRAVTLAPRRAGVLRIAHGAVWVTTGQGSGLGADDLFLASGQSLVVQPGQRLVMESHASGTPVAAWFLWDPLAQVACAPLPRIEISRWLAVTQPLADLRLALVFGLGALARLLRGVASLVLGARPRGARADRALSALAKARRSQGAMSAGDSIALSGAV